MEVSASLAEVRGSEEGHLNIDMHVGSKYTTLRII